MQYFVIGDRDFSIGGLFDAYRMRYFFSIQHNITGHGTFVEVTGWR